MPPMVTQVSDTELSQRILEMATTGVYRESIFEALQPLATKKQIRTAIAHAKQFGLYSVRHLRDDELGTYYEVNPSKYQSFQAAMAANLDLPAEDDLAAQILASTQTLRALLAIAGAGAVLLFVAGGIGLVMGYLQAGRLAWASALSASGIWLLQTMWARSHIRLR